MDKSKLKKELFDQFKDDFKISPVASIHGLLWKLLSENEYKGQIVVLYPEYAKNLMGQEVLQLLIVKANIAGYIPTYVEFANDDLDNARHIVSELNERIWGVTEEVQEMIVDSSMAAQGLSEEVEVDE